MMTNQKPLILHISKHFLPVYGGLERIIEGTIFYTRSDFDSISMCYNDDLNGLQNKLLPFEDVNSISVHRIKCIKIGWLHFGFFKPSLILKADIIHVHNCDLLLDIIILFKFLTGFKAKIIASSHGLIFHHNQFKSLKVLYLRLSFFVKNKFTDKIIANGLNDYKFLIEVLKSKKTVLIENPVSMKYHKINSERSGIISVNRLQNSKNIERNIQICEQLILLGFNEPIRFIVSGKDGEIKKLMEKQSVRNPRFQFIANCSEQEKWNLFSESRYFIHSAEYEGFGISVLESLLSGCLTFVTDQVAGNFRHHQFTNLFSFSLTDSNETIGRRILAEVYFSTPVISEETKNNFDWNHQGQKFSEIYKQVLSDNEH